MKLMSLKQFEKKSRGSLMRFINGYLKTQSTKQLAKFAYTLAKSKLPRLRTVRQKALPKHKTIKRITRRLSKDEKERRQQKLKAINSWRKSKGMKRIVVK